MKRLLLSLLTCCTLAVASYNSARAASAIVEGAINCDRLSDACFLADLKLDGQIDASTVAKLNRLIDELHKEADRRKKRVHIFSVKLNSPGGSVTAAFAIGRILRRERMGATIAGAFPPSAPGICNSACVLIYAGAVHRSFNQGASRLGIHRPYLEVPQQDVAADKVGELYRQMLESVRSYLREMNVSDQLAEAMFRIEPEKVRFLTEKAAVDFGLTEWDAVYKEVSDVQEARKLGLSRQEYMRRRARAISGCPWFSALQDNKIDDWMYCYNGLMATNQPAPVRVPLPAPSPPGAPDFSQYGTPAEPIDLSRYPLR